MLVMAQLGYDATMLGTHQFDLGRTDLDRALKPDAAITRGGVRFGIFGLIGRRASRRCR